VSFIRFFAILSFSLLLSSVSAKTLEFKIKDSRSLSHLELVLADFSKNPQLALNSLKQIYKQDSNQLINNLKFKKRYEKLGLDNIYRLDCDTADCDTIVKKLNESRLYEYVEVDKVLKFQRSSADPFLNSNGSFWNKAFSETWGLEQSKAKEAWTLTQGNNSVVAILDEGLSYNHPDLFSNIWVDPDLVTDRNLDGSINLKDLDLNNNNAVDSNEMLLGSIGKDFYKEINSSEQYMKDYVGHGTFMAGIVAGVKDNGLGLSGVAPRARIMPIKIIGPSGEGTISGTADAIRYAADKSASAIALSVLWSVDSSTIKSAIDYARAKGTIMIVAAGNGNTLLSNYEAKYPAYYSILDKVISVSSVNPNLTVDSFANYGSGINILAPGSEIVSTGNNVTLIGQSFPEVYDGLSDLIVTPEKESYYVVQGTSFACPYVAGAVALIKSIDPNASFAQIKNALQNSSSKSFTNNQGKFFDGTVGVLNIKAALDAYSSSPAPPPAKGSLTLRSGYFRENSLYTSGTLDVVGGDYASYQYIYTLIEGAETFQINGSSLRAINTLDYEQRTSYTVKVRATAPNDTYLESVFTIDVTNDPSDDPKLVEISHTDIEENNSIGDDIGRLSVNGFSYIYNFSLSGPDADKFIISGPRLLANAVFDYETKNSFNITVNAVGDAGLNLDPATTDITITVTDQSYPLSPPNRLVPDTSLRILRRSGNQVSQTIAKFKTIKESSENISLSITGNKRSMKYLGVRDNEIFIKTPFPEKFFANRISILYSVRAGNLSYRGTLGLR
jgi:subtilisin family serine protease